MTGGQARGGYVYFLTNPSMPGMIKIGKTTRHPEKRTAELTAATGVPTPFRLEGFIPTPNPSRTEAEIHRRLGSRRVNSRREFFNLNVQDAISIGRDVASQEKLSFKKRKSSTADGSLVAILAIVTWFNGLLWLLGLHANPIVVWLIANIALLILTPNTIWKFASRAVVQNKLMSLLVMGGSLVAVKVLYPDNLILAHLFLSW